MIKIYCMIFLFLCFSHCSVAVKRQHDQGNSYKRNHLTGTFFTFRGVVHHHGGEHSCTQADMVLVE